MKNASKVLFKTINQAVSTNTPGLGVMYLAGPTELGQFNDPSSLIINKTQFRKEFGTGIIGSNFNLMVEKVLDAGVMVRVARVSTIDMESAQITLNGGSPESPVGIFKLIAKLPGTAFNTMTATISEDTPDTVGHVQLTINWRDIKEIYSIPSPLTLETYVDYLAEIQEKSTLVDVDYITIEEGDLPLTILLTDEPVTPQILGVDGAETDSTAYSSNTFASFDEYDDGVVMVFPDEMSDHAEKKLLAEKVSAYVAGREDMVMVASVPWELDWAASVAYAESLTISNGKYSVLTHGGLKVASDTGVVNIPESVFVGARIVNQYNSKPWISSSGLTYGLIGGHNGVINNYGTPAKLAALEQLTEAGVNSVVTSYGVTCLWNAYTMADEDSQEKFLNTILLEIYIKRVIKPTMAKFLSHPNDMETWSTIYYRVRPFLDSLVENRAFYEYSWEGDQFVTSLDELQINTAEDVQNGLYKAVLQAKLISPIVTITIEFYKQSLTA